MKKFKKAMALSLALAMGLSMVACGDKKEETTAAPATEATEADTEATEADTEADTEATEADTEVTEAPAAEGAIAAPDTSGWDDSKKIYAYTWDDNFQKTVQLLLDKYPEYKDYVEFVNLGVGGQSEDWLQGVDTALESGDKYPSLIPADIGVAKYWSEDDTKTLDLQSIGITKDMYADNYAFALDFATYGSELKTVTYQANPGSLFYRADIAEEVFGSSDPDAIQNEVKDWDSFFAAADKLKEAGYFIVSGPADVKYPIWETKSNPWVTVADDGSETLTLDSSVTTYLETAKKLYDGGYTNGVAGMWQDDWYADCKDDSKVFSYFGCPWFIGCLQGWGATDGNWRTCVGPSKFHWGGTYVSVGKDTPNPELCAWICYELMADADFAVELVNSDCDTNCSSNKTANARLAGGELSSDFAATKFFGGQNPFEVWSEAADGINLANETYADGTIQGYIDNASTAFNAGTYATVDEALQNVKDQAASGLGLSE